MSNDSKPFYCFKLDEKTGVITRYEVTEYEVEEHSYFKGEYSTFRFSSCFGTKSTTRQSVDSDNFEHYANRRYFTFDPDMERAVQAIHEAINERLDDAKEDVKKYTKIRKNIEKKYGDRDWSAELKETDLEAVKSITKSISHTKPKPVGKGILSAFADHPFLSDMFWMEKAYKNKDNNIQNYPFSNEKLFGEWTDSFAKIVDKCMTLAHVYVLWRNPWKLAFMKLCGAYLSEKDYAEYLANSWVLEENPNMDKNVSREEALEMFRKADKRYLMDEEDYHYYLNLPDTLEVYRGVSKGRIDLGLSWTDDKEKAEWFMNRFAEINSDDEIKLLKATISKDNVIAYFNTKGEKEILLDVFAVEDRIERVM